MTVAPSPTAAPDCTIADAAEGPHLLVSKSSGAVRQAAARSPSGIGAIFVDEGLLEDAIAVADSAPLPLRDD